jgi:hypothetical protein
MRLAATEESKRSFSWQQGFFILKYWPSVTAKPMWFLTDGNAYCSQP